MGGINFLAVFSSDPCKTAFQLGLLELEKSLSQLRTIHQVSQCSILFLGLALSLRSYFVRELLVCWLLFSLVFMLLIILILVGWFAARAGNLIIIWASTARTRASILSLSPVRLPIKIASVGRKANRFSSDHW